MSMPNSWPPIRDDLIAMSRLVHQRSPAPPRPCCRGPLIAEQVVAGDAQIDRIRDHIEDQIFELLSLQNRSPATSGC